MNHKTQKNKQLKRQENMFFFVVVLLVCGALEKKQPVAGTVMGKHCRWPVALGVVTSGFQTVVLQQV